VVLLDQPPVEDMFREVLLRIVGHGWQSWEFKADMYHPAHRTPEEGDFPDSAVPHPGQHLPMAGELPELAIQTSPSNPAEWAPRFVGHGWLPRTVGRSWQFWEYDSALHPSAHQVPMGGDLPGSDRHHPELLLPMEGWIPELATQASPRTSSVDEWLLRIVGYGRQCRTPSFAMQHPAHRMPMEGESPDFATHHMGHQPWLLRIVGHGWLLRIVWHGWQFWEYDFAMHHPAHRY